VKSAGNGEKPESATRLKQKTTAKQDILFPPNPAEYLTDWFREIGPTIASPMGEVAIGWSDMVAWQELTGIELDAWEARTIRRMSRAFIDQRHEAKKPDCVEPRLKADEEKVEAESRNRVADQFKAMVGALKGRTRQAG
jgi:hypothetical protein